MRPAVAELYDDEERIALLIDHENLVIDARELALTSTSRYIAATR
jgi:hypothetical protein